MKTNTKLPINNYVTKKDLNNLQETLGQSLDKIIEKQNKYFTNILHEMFNKVGIKFDEQDKRFNQIDKKFEQVDKRFDQLQKEIIKNRKGIIKNREGIDNNRKEIKNSKNELLESNLQIIDELKTSREEQTILGYRQSKHTDKLKNHNTKISTLENNYQTVN